MTLKRSACNGPCSESDYTWHLLDSLKDHPQLIESENNWRNLQGSILTFQRGSVWDGLGPASDLHLADSSVPFNPNSFVYQTTFHLDTTPQTHTIQDSQSTCTTQPPLNHSIVNENRTQTVSQVNHAHSKMYDIPENPQGPLQNRKHALKIMTMNVRGLFKSHWDLCHTIAIHNPDVIVLTETKLRRSNKPRPWLESLLKDYKYWSAFDRTGGTTICIHNTLALATQCSPVCFNSSREELPQSYSREPMPIFFC